MKKSNIKRIKKRRKSKGKAPRITIRNTQRDLTSRGGLVSVVGFMESFGYEKIFEKVSGFHRAPNARYSLYDAVSLSAIGYISGISTLSGTSLVWKDRVLQKIAGYFQTPDASTLGRIFSKLRARDIVEMESFIHRLRQRIWSEAKPLGGKEKLWVDGDSTVSTSYGHQEGADKGYNPHKKGANSYHPLLAFATATREILQGWFRTGSAYTSNGIVGFLQQLLAQFPQEQKIVFRADSGFFNGALFDFLEGRKCDYLVKVKLKNLKTLLSTQSYTPVEGHPGWEACTFEYQAAGWSRKRTFKAVRQHKVTPLKEALIDCLETYEYFCYVSTLNLDPWAMHQCYARRATSETWIEEAKSQIKPARMQSFFASAAAFQSAILAYNTLRWMVLFTSDAFLKRMEVKTLRLLLIHTAAKLTYRARRYVLNFTADLLYPKQWEAWMKLAAPT